MKMLLALAAACFIGGGFVAQQHAAYNEPLDEILRLKLLARLLCKPLWLLGLGLMIIGQVLGALALDQADLGRVEPLLATNLIFALIISHLVYQERLDRVILGGGLLVSGGSTVFLFFGQPHGGSPAGPESPRWITGAIVIGIAAALALLARPSTLKVKAMLLATSAGILFGVQDALTRGSLLLLNGGLLSLIGSWEPYALIGIAVLSLLFAQSAFDAAPINISLPATTAAEPVTGIVLGVFVFSERLHLSVGALAAEVGGLTMMVVGILVLGRSQFLVKRSVEEEIESAEAQSR